MIQALGYDTHLCANGQEVLNALSHSEKDEYSLILMDCQMPVLDGFNTTEKIRNGDAGKQHRDITIVAVTANAMEGDKEKCIAAGMNDYLTKPIDKTSLCEKIENWIAG
jgi:CheY-like chemotaxis protein